MGKKRQKFSDLVRVYQDLEKTIKSLKKSSDRNLPSSLSHINVRALIAQLTRSKKQLERKIGNTLLLEKQHLKQRLKALTNQISSQK